MGDVLKVWGYAIASVFLGAWVAPWLYNIGKTLAEVTSGKQTNGLIEWVAGFCRQADFPQFFVISLCLMAAVLGILWAVLMRVGRGGGGLNGPWQIRSASVLGPLYHDQALVRNPEAWRHVLLGLGMGGVMGVLWLVFGNMWLGGAVRFVPVSLRSLMGFWIFAMGLGVLQEIFFRGVVLGIFLRAMRPVLALGLASVLFALVHLLIPAAGVDVVDPEASAVGFEMLGLLGSHVFQVKVILGSVVPLLALGGVLAFARWRTASLWLPIGLHVGWSFAMQMEACFTVRVAHWNGDIAAVVSVCGAGCIIKYLTTDGARITAKG